MAAFDPMVLFARHLAARAFAANHDPAFFGVNLDLIALKARDFRGQDEAACGLVEIDRRVPSGRVAANELTDLIVQDQQIAQRIPP
ncbi:MAG: hypothetical protein QM736_14920 [Vicinamibacterales bacterium]